MIPKNSQKTNLKGFYFYVFFCIVSYKGSQWSEGSAQVPRMWIMYELTYSYFPTTKMDSETYSNHSDLCGEDACHYLCTFLSEKLIHIKVRKYLTNSLASLCKQKETNICSDELIIYSALLHHSLCAVCYCRRVLYLLCGFLESKRGSKA